MDVLTQAHVGHSQATLAKVPVAQPWRNRGLSGDPAAPGDVAPTAPQAASLR